MCPLAVANAVMARTSGSWVEHDDEGEDQHQDPANGQLRAALQRSLEQRHREGHRARREHRDGNRHRDEREQDQGVVHSPLVRERHYASSRSEETSSTGRGRRDTMGRW
jgi:hypothetical protein